MERKAAVAGQFYPGTRSALEAEVQRLLRCDEKPRSVLAAIAPHAGYQYSGAIAGEVFATVEVPPRCIILSPNHTGMGARAAAWASGEWAIPTGRIAVDEALAQEVIRQSGEIVDDPSAHIAEHSIEVMLPFLLARRPDVSIVPITLGRLGAKECEGMGGAIAEAIRGAGGGVLIVASTDMNHYERQRETMEKDDLAIARVLKLDAAGLMATCAERRISMCGVVPTAVAIAACKALGAKKATLVGHATSGDVTGDMGAVVGYAGFVIE